MANAEMGEQRGPHKRASGETGVGKVHCILAFLPILDQVADKILLEGPSLLPYAKQLGVCE
jgi:hypothetical protein